MKAENSALLVLLRACAKNKDLYEGARVHAHILKWGLLEKWACVPSSLVSMYSKCGALTKARELLDDIPFRDVFSWTALIAGFVDHGPSEEALNCFESMQLDGIHPNAVTFTCILKACGNLGVIAKGEQIHDEIVRQGLLVDNVVLGSALVCMYAKCGALVKAHRVLGELPVRNAVSWNALIGGYAQQGQGKEALSCFDQMQDEGLLPDAITFLLILKSCAAIRAIDDGERIHHEMLRLGILEISIDLGNALVDLYAKCGAFEKAQQLLEELPFQNVVTWNALITGYTQQGQGVKALKCFECMQLKSLSPNGVTYICLLKACGNVRAIEKGRAIHDEILNQRLLENNVALGTALVDMYANCGALVKAQEVLDSIPVRDVVCWNALIAGYTQEGLSAKALSCFKRMQDEGCSPNAMTFSCVLKACCSRGFIQEGEEIHEVIMRRQLLGNNIVLGTALVDFYVKHGVLVKARQVLEGLPARDIVSWNALIAGYAQQGFSEEALDCLEQMQHDDALSPNEVTLSCILKACGTIGALDKGEQIHDEIARQGLLRNNTILGNSLVDMYVKCGALEKAWQVLEEFPVGNVVSWSAVIAGYVQQGRGKEALKCFGRMQQRGFSPDAITFSCLLNACSQSGLVEEGQMFFETMRTKYGFKPDIEHCTCMVKLFGHAGQFEKVVGIIERMPSCASSVVWSAMLGACEKWGDVEVGRWAFEHVLQSDKSDACMG